MRKVPSFFKRITGSIVGTYVFPSIEVRVDVPVKNAPSTFNTLVLSSKQKTIKLCINSKTRESFIWCPHELDYSVRTTRKGKEKFLNTTQFGWGPVPPRFAEEVARQFEQGNKQIRLDMHQTQLTGRPA